MGFGSVLSEILKTRNISIYQLSKSTEIPATTIHAIIKRDSNNVNIETVRKIADFLGMTVDEFLEWDMVEKTINEELSRLDKMTRQYISIFEMNGYKIELDKEQVQIVDEKNISHTVARRDFMSMIQYCHNDITHNIEKLLRDYHQ